MGYNILHIISHNKELREIVEKQFPSEKIATDASVQDFIEHHHTYMQNVFLDYELDLRKDLPKQYSRIDSQFRISSVLGGKFTRFVPKDIFWKEKDNQSA